LSASDHPTNGGAKRGWLACPGGRLRLIGGVVGAALALGAPVAAGAATGPAATPPDGSSNFAFQTLNDHRDVTFNQLLGIDNGGLIVGYFGSGAAGHPNKGYRLGKPYGQGSYRNENYPHSRQTQVTGLNDHGVTVGFYSDTNKANPADNANFGFYAIGGRFHRVVFPGVAKSKPPIGQLLGVNDHDVAVGFYNDAKNVSHGYTYNIRTGRFRRVIVAGDTNVTAAAINNFGDIAGSATNSAGATEGFLLRSDGKLFRLDVPGASSTQAFGLNDGDEVVGAYMVGSGSSALTYGFVWTPGTGFETVNDPNGVGSTTINGVNDRGTIVGFYTDSAGNTDGMLAHPIG
jgi:hypothetical protein